MKLSFIQFFCVSLLISIIYSCKKEYSCEGCIQSNKPPVAIAGNDTAIVLPINTIVLNGSASFDPDGKIVSYEWSKLSGPVAIIIDKPAMVNTPVKNMTLGVYQFELSVKDDGGLISKDTVQIEVLAAPNTNHPPVAMAGSDQTISLPTNSVIVDGSKSTDPDNDIVNYSWRKVSGPQEYSITNQSSMQTQIRGLISGLYQFELTVTDAQGLSSKDTVSILVNNNAPTSNVNGDIIVTLPLNSVNIGWYHYADSFNWTIISGPPGSIISNTVLSGVALVSNLVAGSYSFRYEETNGTIVTADTITVTVINDPFDPNTITFKDLHWIIADEYGVGIDVLSLRVADLPMLFVDPFATQVLMVYLQPDPSSPWLLLPSAPYVFDGFNGHIWIMRNPVDASWVGKSSNVKIKLP